MGKRELQTEDEIPTNHESDEITTEQPWQQVRRALSCLHGEYERRAQDEAEKEKLEKEVTELRTLQAKNEEITQQKERIFNSMLLRRETAIAEKEEELEAVERQLQETRRAAEQELARVKSELEDMRMEVEQARSRSASMERTPDEPETTMQACQVEAAATQTSP